MISRDELIENIRRRNDKSLLDRINDKISDKDKSRQRARAEIENRRIEREYRESQKDYLDE